MWCRDHGSSLPQTDNTSGASRQNGACARRSRPTRVSTCRSSGGAVSPKRGLSKCDFSTSKTRYRARATRRARTLPAGPAPAIVMSYALIASTPVQGSWCGWPSCLPCWSALFSGPCHLSPASRRIGSRSRNQPSCGRCLIEFDLIEIFWRALGRRLDDKAERRPEVHHFILRLHFTETKRRLRSRHSCPRSPIFRAIKGEHFVGAGHWPPSDSTLSARDRLVVDRASRAVEEIGLPRQGHLLREGAGFNDHAPSAFSRHRNGSHGPIASKPERFFPDFLLRE